MVEDCIFCKIASGKQKAHVIYEDGLVVAFLDIRPRNPGHTLVITKKHVETILEIDEKTMGELYKVVRRLAPFIVKAVGADGVNVIQSNRVAQGINHFHTHILPRFFNDGMPIVWESMNVAKDEELSIVEQRIKSSIK